MSVFNEKITFPTDASMILRESEVPHFTFPYHYHMEYELVYVKQGYGIRYVGDHFEKFEAGDMVLLAPNLPHCWESDKAFYLNNPNLRVKAIVAQMPDVFFNTIIATYPEFRNIKKLFELSNRGCQIMGSTRNEAAIKLKALTKEKGLKRLLEFISILDDIAGSNNIRILSGNISTSGNTRMSRVIDFINSNYQNSIGLTQLCELTGLTPTGFCLWFKRNTGKTFSGYLHEVRIDKACYLLKTPVNAEVKIADVAFMTGFENLSNFNRVFKNITGLSPKNYRRS